MRTFSSGRVSIAEVLAIIAERIGGGPPAAAKALTAAAQNGAVEAWGTPWNNHAGYPLSKSPLRMPPHAWELWEFNEGELQLFQMWSNGVRGESKWRDIEFLPEDVDKLWRPVDAPPKPARARRNVNIVGQLVEFLNTHPGMKEPDARAAAENDGLEFSKREWEEARRGVPAAVKHPRHRPKASVG